MTTPQNARAGVWLMIMAATIFAAQDGISRHLAETYNLWIVVMIRFWAFALFVLATAARSPGGIRATARTQFPQLQLCLLYTSPSPRD